MNKRLKISSSDILSYIRRPIPPSTKIILDKKSKIKNKRLNKIEAQNYE